MDIQWLGQCCFRIRGKEALVLIDPFDARLGLSMPRMTPHIVLLTHEHPGHLSIKGIGGDFRLVRGAGEFEIRGVSIRGTQASSDGQRDAHGRLTLYTVEVDDISVCHLGHLQDKLTEPQLEAIGRVDVLLVPIGGQGITINAAQAAEVVSQIEPKLVVPMHYQIPGLTLTLDPVERFVKEMGVTDAAPQPKLTLSSAPSVEDTKVVILEARGAKED
jgi:L-ascorbate metabolism protein UlaG (beta-lactamase superfamily)